MKRPFLVPFGMQLFFIFALLVSANFAQPTHPLDPLSADEIQSAVKILKATPNFPKEVFFSTVQLNEPPKSEVWSYKSGAPFRREALIIVMERKLNQTFEALIDLRGQKIISWKEIPGVQPLIFDQEYEDLRRIVKADPRWQAAMRKRGFTDFDQIEVDGWAVGRVEPKFTGRLMRGLSYLKGTEDNYYGRPIEGVVALVDITRGVVVDLIDSGVIPIAKSSQDFSEEAIGKLREKPKPLVISQPDGASYTINGNEISWQKWRFRYTMHPREGIVLHTVSYDDNGKLRPILYRAALSEMVVPYGDPDQNWRWRAAFDVGEYNIGRNSYPLEKNLDAPENAQFLDAVFADDEGQVSERKGILAIFERDGGIAWKHYNFLTEKNETRRARELVLSAVATIGNYDYAINYIFKQDGSLEVDLALTGIMLAKGVREKRADEGNHSMMKMDSTGHLVAENVVAPHHQHFFNFRLDFDIDGTNNSVTEMNSSALPTGSNNPYLNGFMMRETMFKNEVEAQRNLDLQSSRVWAVMNPTIKNSLGQNTSFIIAPGANTLPFVAVDSSVRKRAGFINHHFWATRYHPGEIYAAGMYPNQSKGGAGLPNYASNNEAIQNTDVVIWYTLGITHIPRPEEWSVMPTTHIGFKILPGAFFDRNPALDIPR
jgi:primary-amine oxidase